MKKSLILSIILFLQSFPSYGITVRELGDTVVSTIQIIISSTILFFWEIYDKVQNGNVLDLQISQFIFLFILVMIPIGFIGMIFGFMNDILEDYCERKDLNYEKIRNRTFTICWIFLFVGCFSIIFILDPP